MEKIGYDGEHLQMKKMLRETHKDSNIIYLRARDFYFKEAIKVYNIKRILAAFPTILVVISYLIIILSHEFEQLSLPDFSEGLWADGFELIVGTLTVIFCIIIKVLEKQIDNHKEISNIFREAYDKNIFELEDNLFSYDYGIIESRKKNGIYSPEDYNNWKYEYWYDETFSDDVRRNVLCMQMDNALYSFNVFVLCKKEYVKQLIWMSALLVFLIVVSICKVDWTMCFLIFFAMFELLKQKWEDIQTSEEIIEMNKHLIEIVQKKENVEEILSNLQYHIQCIEERMIENRKKGLFLPKKIRNLYIDYYPDLDRIKSLYMNDETVGFPESSHELEIYSSDESKIYTLNQIQERLQLILEDVAKVFEENRIPYYLDRGTLLGAVRKNISGVITEENMKQENFNISDYIDLKKGGFLFWEDSVNIIISSEFEAEAKELLRKEYQAKYVIQDYTTEKMLVSHRHSFRVREKNSVSQLVEKDRAGAFYEEKGIYIVVNILSPVIVNIFVDKLIRFFLFEGLVKRLDKHRDKIYWAHIKEKTSKCCRLGKKYKKLYVKYDCRLKWYLSHARCHNTLSYAPGTSHLYEKYPIERKLREFIQERFNIDVNELEKGISGYVKKIYAFWAKRDNNDVTFCVKARRRMRFVWRRKKYPYFSNREVFKGYACASFEERQYPIPNNYDLYLTKLYGAEWIVSPFSAQSDLRRYYGDSWYSVANQFHMSSLKHTRHVDFKDA